MITSVLPTEATHTSLDLFQREALLVSLDSGFEQRVGPIYATDGPTIECKVVGDRNNFIDMNHIFLEVVASIHQHDGTNLRYDATTAADSDEPCFVNNALHSMFSECDVYTNGIKISSANGLYAHKSYLETEMSHSKEAKETWLICQGYNFESNPATFASNDIKTKREPASRNSALVHIIRRLSVDFLIVTNYFYQTLACT